MPMLREAAGPLETSIFVEGLRAAPAGFLGLGLIAHALLWAIATHFAEPAPPPQMAVTLALGREWFLGYAEMPPLAAWTSETIYRATGSLFALRLASALCVALAGWIVFLFARRVIGDRQGAIAVLLMVSIFPVAFPGSSLTGDLLLMPLVAAAFLAWWVAAGEKNPNAWVVLGAILGVTIYAGPQGLVLLVALAAVTVSSARMRAVVARSDALLSIAFGLFVFGFIAGPRLLWLWQNGWSNLLAGAGAGIAPGEMISPLRLSFGILLGHFGFALLVFLATAYAAKEKDNAPVFVREPTALASRRGVVALALAPALLALLALYGFDASARLQLFSPLLMLTGIAVVIIGGDRLIVRRQRFVGAIALIFLFAPPAMQLVFSFAPGWFGENRPANWPASALARTFNEIYQTRTGRPLEFVVGERVQASQVSVLSVNRPRVFIDADRTRTPWIDEAEFKKKGGIVFWQIRGADNAPPQDYVARLPAFTEEAPLRLPWARGGGDPVRLGWAIVPPAQ